MTFIPQLGVQIRGLKPTKKMLKFLFVSVKNDHTRVSEPTDIWLRKSCRKALHMIQVRIGSALDACYTNSLRVTVLSDNTKQR